MSFQRIVKSLGEDATFLCGSTDSQDQVITVKFTSVVTKQTEIVLNMLKTNGEGTGDD